MCTAPQSTFRIQPPAAAFAFARAGIIAPLLALLFVLCFGLLLLARIGPLPLGDSGGYENMLRFFQQTGKVDYMRWSQPTFVGMLPAAIAWTSLFGSSTASLQSLIVLHSLGLALGLYIFCARYTAPPVAALIAAMLVCSQEYVLQSTAFMTDIPYAAYLVGFLLAHQALEARYRRGEASKGIAGLWAAWTVLFLLAALTRSFTLALVPAFLLQAALRKESAGRFAKISAGLSLLAAVAFALIVHAMTTNGFKISELIVYREVIVAHQWARFDLRMMLICIIQTGAMLLPALLLVAPSLPGKLSRREIGAGSLTLALGLYFGRKGLLVPLLALSAGGTPQKFLIALTALCAPVGIILMGRLLRSFLAEKPDNITLTLLTLFAAHILILPFMQHPLLRHVFPAYLAALMLIAMRRPVGNKALCRAALAGALLIGGSNFASANLARQTNQAQWNFAARLREEGKPLASIDGGWGWFCQYHLVPGSAENDSYYRRYVHLQETARYVVTVEDAAPVDSRLVSSQIIAPPGGRRKAQVFERQQTAHQDAPKGRKITAITDRLSKL